MLHRTLRTLAHFNAQKSKVTANQDGLVFVLILSNYQMKQSGASSVCILEKLFISLDMPAINL